MTLKLKVIQGHLFHINFGKFLGDAQMFGSFNRDRTPFIFTPDMVYVINGGDKPTVKFQYFVDLCCKAFNIIRKNGNLLLNLFALVRLFLEHLFVLSLITYLIWYFGRLTVSYACHLGKFFKVGDAESCSGRLLSINE